MSIQLESFVPIVLGEGDTAAHRVARERRREVCRDVAEERR